MSDKRFQIYRFRNATLIRGSVTDSIILLEDGEPVAESARLLSEAARNGLGLYSNRLHGVTHGELRLISSRWTQETVSYVPKDSSLGLRELSEEEYSLLSKGFQIRYGRKLSEPTETRTELEFELKELGFDLEEEILRGNQFPTELHRRIKPIRDRARRADGYGSYSRDPLEIDLNRNLPLELTGSEIIYLIEGLGGAIKASSGYGATVSVSMGFREPPSIELNFFARPYDGSMKKVLHRKKNGQPYADNRGQMVKETPPVVGTASITEKDVSNWWNSIGGPELSEEAKLEALQAFTRMLWRFKD